MRPHKLVLLALLVLLAACNSGALPVEAQEIGALEYEMPNNWKVHVRQESGRQVAEWVPDENDRKESITIVYSEPLPALAKAGRGHVARHLVDLQRTLHGTFDSPVQVKSRHGFAGVSVDGSFTPSDAAHPYHRTHAALIADDRIVHVLYTAPQGVSNRELVSAVINSFHRKGT